MKINLINGKVQDDIDTAHKTEWWYSAQNVAFETPAAYSHDENWKQLKNAHNNKEKPT